MTLCLSDAELLEVTGRVRSTGESLDVSEIAKQYGGGYGNGDGDGDGYGNGDGDGYGDGYGSGYGTVSLYRARREK